VKYISHLSIGILILGAILRLKVYLDNRDFFLDEINLCRNIATKDLLELFQPLDFGQHAPPVFLTFTKWISQIGGINEYSFRFLPLLAGLASLVLFYKLCKHFISGIAILFPIILFSFSIYLVEFASTAKQYSFDVFICLALMYFAIQVKKDRRQMLAFSIVAAICVWLSMPSIFVLAATGIYFLFKKDNQDLSSSWQINKNIILYGCCALGSFILYYFLILNNSLGSDNLADFHQQYFLPIPDSKEDALLFFENIISLFRSIVGKTAVPIIIAVLLFALGIFKQTKRNLGALILLIGPVVFCLAASMMSLYSLLVRLTLFLLPLLMIMMGIGLAFSIEKIKTLPSKIAYPGYFILSVLIVLCIPQRNGLHFFAKPFIKEQSKASLRFIAESSYNKNHIYILHSAEPAYTFYTSIHDHKIPIPSQDLFFADWDSDFRRKAKEWKSEGHDLVWIFDCHTFGESLNKINRVISQSGKVVEQHVDVNGYAKLVQLK